MSWLTKTIKRPSDKTLERGEFDLAKYRAYDHHSLGHKLKCVHALSLPIFIVATIAAVILNIALLGMAAALLFFANAFYLLVMIDNDASYDEVDYARFLKKMTGSRSLRAYMKYKKSGEKALSAARKEVGIGKYDFVPKYIELLEKAYNHDLYTPEQLQTKLQEWVEIEQDRKEIRSALSKTHEDLQEAKMLEQSLTAIDAHIQSKIDHVRTDAHNEFGVFLDTDLPVDLTILLSVQKSCELYIDTFSHDEVKDNTKYISAWKFRDKVQDHIKLVKARQVPPEVLVGIQKAAKYLQNETIDTKDLHLSDVSSTLQV